MNCDIGNPNGGVQASPGLPKRSAGYPGKRSATYWVLLDFQDNLLISKDPFTLPRYTSTFRLAGALVISKSSPWGTMVIWPNSRSNCL